VLLAVFFGGGTDPCRSSCDPRFQIVRHHTVEYPRGAGVVAPFDEMVEMPATQTFKDRAP
jgi:hypothetical protein